MVRRRATKELLTRELARFRRAFEAVRVSPDERRIHAVRVASRRARAAIRLLARRCSPSVARASRSFFRPLADSSGPIRDLDVAMDRVGTRLDRRTRDRWDAARSVASAAFLRRIRRIAPIWKRIESAILAVGVRKRGALVKRWRKRRSTLERRLEEMRERVEARQTLRAAVAAIHDWRRCARRLRFEAEIAGDAELPIGRSLSVAKAIHRGTAEIVDLAMIVRLANRLGDRALGAATRAALADARDAVATLGSGKRLNSRRARERGRPIS